MLWIFVTIINNCGFLWPLCKIVTISTIDHVASCGLSLTSCQSCYIIWNKFDRKIFQKLYSFYVLIFGHLYTSCHMYWTQRQKLWLKFSPFGSSWQTWNLHELKKTSSPLKRASIWVRRSMQTITILRTPYGYKVCILTLQMKIRIKRSSRGILTFTLSILVQENYSNLLQII